MKVIFCTILLCSAVKPISGPDREEDGGDVVHLVALPSPTRSVALACKEVEKSAQECLPDLFLTVSEALLSRAGAVEAAQCYLAQPTVSSAETAHQRWARMQRASEAGC
jgi:hypothetical protein